MKVFWKSNLEKPYLHFLSFQEEIYTAHPRDKDREANLWEKKKKKAIFIKSI